MQTLHIITSLFLALEPTVDPSQSPDSNDTTVAAPADAATPPAQEEKVVPAVPAPEIKTTETKATPAPAVLDVKVSGYLQTQYTGPFLGSPSKDPGALTIRRARLRTKATLVKDFSATVMIDPSTPANLVRDAYFAWTGLLHHEIRVGQQKTQFGYENPESSTKLFTVNRTFMSDKLGRGRDLRDLGIGILGNWTFDTLGVDYALTGVNGAGPNVVLDDTRKKNFWGRAGVSYHVETLHLKVRVGGSYGVGNEKRPFTGTAPKSAFNFDRVGADIQLDHPWVLVLAEYAQGHDEKAHTSNKVTSRGFYVSGIIRTPWNFGPIARFDSYESNIDIVGTEKHRTTVGLYYDVASLNIRFVGNVEILRSTTEETETGYVWAQILF